MLRTTLAALDRGDLSKSDRTVTVHTAGCTLGIYLAASYTGCWTNSWVDPVDGTWTRQLVREGGGDEVSRAPPSGHTPLARSARGCSPRCSRRNLLRVPDDIEDDPKQLSARCSALLVAEEAMAPQRIQAEKPLWYKMRWEAWMRKGTSVGSEVTISSDSSSGMCCSTRMLSASSACWTSNLCCFLAALAASLRAASFLFLCAGVRSCHSKAGGAGG